MILAAKAGLCILLAAGGTGTGFYFSALLTRRREQLSQLIQGLEILKSEIYNSRLPMKYVFRHAAAISCGAAALLFDRFSDILETGDLREVEVLWEKTVLEVFPESGPMKKKDRAVLQALGSRLGALDSEEQCQDIQRAVRELSICLSEASEEVQTKGRVYRTAGTAAGLLLVVLIL